MKDIYKASTLVGQKSKHWLPHGHTKRYVDNYHYHSPNVGIVASYTPKQRDVKDHFNIFRGVDQIESFAQATIVSNGVFLECKKMNIEPNQLAEKFVATFISVGNVHFQSYLEKGETFVNIGCVKFYKFRQMVCDGRIYKVPKGFNLDEYFKDFTDERLLSYDLGSDFKLVAELYDITGRAIKKELFNSL